MDVLTRGKLAQLAQVNPETIRFYEREGILPPAGRTRNGYRKFPASTVESDSVRWTGEGTWLFTAGNP
jgi:predicted site-specific integrase-resolvase